MTDSNIYEQARNYFEQSLTNHGATPRGVDWNSVSAQEIRFVQLIKVIQPSQPFSLLDYGSGYGALVDYLLRLGYPVQQYIGYDILESMAAQGRDLHASRAKDTGAQGALAQCAFTSHFDDLSPADYLVSSGIFNVKQDRTYEEWTAYVLDELNKMNQLCRKGFSFNMLTKYSDAEYMRANLYYADPCYIFDYCKRNFSRNVALLHDYDIYDFTILVRKSGS